MVADPTAPERSRWQMFTGQSGHPASPHYDDLQADWLEGRTQPMAGEGPWRELDLVPPPERPAELHQLLGLPGGKFDAVRLGCGPNRSPAAIVGAVMRLLRPALAGARAACASPPRRPRPGRSTSRARAVRVPAGWPVFRLAEHPRHVRAARPPRRLPGDGRAPASAAPSHAIGRQRAILVDPGAATSAARRQRDRAAGADAVPAPTTSPASASTPARRPRRGRWRPGQPRPTGRSASTSAASTAPARSPT